MSTKTLIQNLEDNFFLRRLHSLSGMFPIGAYMVFHLFMNSVATFSPENFNNVIHFLRSIPYLELLEIMVLFVPIVFHALYGLIITRTSKPNQMTYSHLENWRYYLQRVTGVIGLFFIWFHVYQLRFVEDLDYDYIANAFAGYAHFSFLPEIPLINPLNVYWFYIICVVALIYHFANGIWSFCITWGITVGKKSQELVSLAALAIFIALSWMTINTINSFAAAGHAIHG